MLTQPKVKICGITDVLQLALLDDHEVDFAGIWHGVPNGKHNLNTEQFVEVSAYPARITTPVLVTIGSDSDSILEILDLTGVDTLQLHGFESPRLIKAIKSYAPLNIKIFKALHCNNKGCIESPYIKHYLEAGVDYFIFDNYIDKNQLGSTGERLAPDIVHQIIRKHRLDNNFMIAGGITPENIIEIASEFQPMGFDIDSGARQTGVISTDLVSSLVHSSRNLDFQTENLSA